MEDPAYSVHKKRLFFFSMILIKTNQVVISNTFVYCCFVAIRKLTFFINFVDGILKENRPLAGI